MCKTSFTYNGGVVHSVSNYRKKYYEKKYENGVPTDTDAVAIQAMLVEYHTPGTTNERKKELKHDILMRAFFLFPHFLKKNYFLPSELFNEAIQNMVANTLQAIELFNPNIGFSFSNYLIGYFKDAATKALKSCNIVSNAVIKSAALEAGTLDDAEDEPAENPYLIKVIGSDVEKDLDAAKTDAEKDRDADSCIVDEGEDSVLESCDGGTEEDVALGNEGDSEVAGYEEAGEGERIKFTDDEEDFETIRAALDEPIHRRQMVIRGAVRVLGNSVELDDSREYAIALGHEKDTDFDGTVHKAELIGWLEEALRKETGLLTDDERYILVHHYGLFGTPQMKYSDIAEERKKNGKGCACSRISQINTSAVKKLRQFFIENEIIDD